MTDEEKRFERRVAEVKRFYLQQKSTRPECMYGAKDCSRCENIDCKIRPYAET